MRIESSKRALFVLLSSTVVVSTSNGLSLNTDPSSSSSSSSSSSGRMGSDAKGKQPITTPRLSSTATAATTPENAERTRKRSRRRLSQAPLVDSTLLRFVSEERRRQEEGSLGMNGEDFRKSSPFMFDPLLNEEDEVFKVDSSSSAGWTTSWWNKDVSVESLVQQQQQQQQRPQIGSPQPEPPLPPSGLVDDNKNNNLVQRETSSETVRTAQWDFWLGQYNRNRVGQTLMAMGVDETSAMMTGKTIQSYVLTRTARRRIRIFLRERDSLWNVPQEEQDDVEEHDWTPDDPTSLPILDGNVSRGRAFPPNYGFGDVVEVMKEYGLSGGDICAVLSHSPSVAMMMPRKSFMVKPESKNLPSLDDEIEIVPTSVNDGDTLEDTLQRALVDLLQDDLGLRKYDARKILRSCPGLLTVRGSQAAVQNVIMMSKLGVSKNSLARDKASLPTVLSRSPAAVFRLVSFFSSDKVRMPIKSIGPLLRRPVSRELLNLVAPVPKLHAGLVVVPSADNVVSEDVESSSSSLGPYEESASWGRFRGQRTQNINSIYRTMTANAQALRFKVGTKDLGKLISAYPSALLLDAKEQILPAASYLVEELGIWEEGLSMVVQEYPMLLGKDVEEMRRVTAYLRYWGVREEDLGSIFRAFPALLTMDIETQMKPIVNFLIKIGVSNIGAFITRLPPVLGYSVEKDLEPKWDYLVKVCLRPTFEINNFPAYFSYPFDRVIQTRYEYLETRGIVRQLVPVDAVVRFGDVDFATKIARDTDGGTGFRAFAGKRKDNSSNNGNNGSGSRKKPNRKKKGPSRPTEATERKDI